MSIIRLIDRTKVYIQSISMIEVLFRSIKKKSQLYSAEYKQILLQAVGTALYKTN